MGSHQQGRLSWESDYKTRLGMEQKRYSICRLARCTDPGTTIYTAVSCGMLSIQNITLHPWSCAKQPLYNTQIQTQGFLSLHSHSCYFRFLYYNTAIMIKAYTGRQTAWLHIFYMSSYIFYTYYYTFM